MEPLELRERILQAPESYKTRPHLWHRYLSMVQPEDVLLEFGVWYGTSINYMADVCPNNTFHGFDSFEGLPENWIAGRPKGYFKVVDRSKFRWRKNVVIHEGQFKDTLPFFSVAGVKFIHIDCDLGSSTDLILSQLEQTILQNRCVLLFDEFYNYPGYEQHEFRAFLDFVNRTGCKVRVMGRNINHQQVLIQVL